MVLTSMLPKMATLAICRYCNRGIVFDNEVIRVLKKMPAWTPATIAGQPVPVSLIQPVTFVGVEQ